MVQLKWQSLNSTVIFSFREPYVHYIERLAEIGNVLRKKRLQFGQKRTNNVLQPYMYIEVSYYYSVKSFSRLKSLMYTTLHLKSFEKGKQQKAMNYV